MSSNMNVSDALPELLDVVDVRIRPAVGSSSLSSSVSAGPASALQSDAMTLDMNRMAIAVDLQECCLPPGWRARYSPHHRKVCYFHESGMQQWTHPSAP
ncbi:hypothetical protein SDRG_01516 [Saprolegnia diclina VS20]|uniref:WW domain-containing protein n=1 Tax=Saprolegnia diclina (strain VS20) TaxID=1156394 RepID=T0QTR5_SAPDV|nr:hypothetical protein SDRG_01516 [Saprolegnia diclina VS20]EQC41554.1 hypothetical protein SDRG_01516 [Saprolegnia diclina VS20]|eukprot:XP_008605268.1 hypothetical protein SDRG_01516 [Saprolegnia diclina VS20]